MGYLRRIEARRIEVVPRYRKPGIGRDVLMARHIVEVLRAFRGRWLALAIEGRRDLFEVGSGVVRRWHTDRIQRHLPACLAIRAYCLRHGLAAELELTWPEPLPAVG